MIVFSFYALLAFTVVGQLFGVAGFRFGVDFGLKIITIAIICRQFWQRFLELELIGAAEREKRKE